MDIEQVARTHAALVRRLGGTAGVAAEAVQHDGLREIGTLGGLPCWSAVATAPASKRLAQGLARRGALGLLLTDAASGGARHLAATMDPVRVTTIRQQDDNALALRRLVEWCHRPSESPVLARALELATALDIDAAGRTTFASLRGLLDDGIRLLPLRLPVRVRHEWLLLQFTRLLFLRFVEGEGWLNGEHSFLADRFDDCFRSRRNAHRHLLAPLFFGTLNRPPSQRSLLARRFGRVPFLNGGLFEPHELERRTTVALPADYWRCVVERLVLHTVVTLEHETLDGSVTPEMLGRVFEGVMAPEQRKRDGAFFTPPELVTAIVREALACHLAPRLRRTEADIRDGLSEPDPTLQHALLATTVLDPAVGSGAFLVGALRLMHGPGPVDRRRIRHLVTRRLHGVDRNPAAVRITELRLWLEVLRAMRGDAVEQVRPLPNLDATVRAGDALLDPLLGTLGVPVVRRLRLAQGAIAGRHGTEKRERLRALRRAEASALTQALAEREQITEQQIRELVVAARAPTLFGTTEPLRAVDRRRLQTLHDTRRELRQELRRIHLGTTTVPFAMATAFAPVLEGRGGFDLVLGNPPWVRAEALPRETRAALALRYRWWRPRQGRGFRQLPDLSIAFVERTMDLLSPAGTCALLLPTKIATAEYATAARAALGRQHTLHVVADLDSDPRATFDATTYPLLLLASRRAPEAEHTTRIGMAHDADHHRQADWGRSSTWLLAPRAVHRLLHRLHSSHPPLSTAFTPQLGIKTGANDAFLDPPATLSPWSRLAVRGRDVRAFSVVPRQRILWPADDQGEPWKRLPEPVAEHLHRFQGRLRNRADYTGGVWWRLFRVQAAMAPHRVVWGDLASCLEAAMLPNAEMVPLNSCYVVAAPSAEASAVLTQWLNSSWIRTIARLGAEPAAGGAVRFGARAVGSVPWVNNALQHPVLRRHAADRDPVATDTAVAELLELSTHDRATLAALATRRR